MKKLVLILISLLFVNNIFSSIDDLESDSRSNKNLLKIYASDLPFEVLDAFHSTLNEFSFDIAEKLYKIKKNLFFSPFGFYSCLYPIYVGSNGETKKEFETKLSFKDSELFRKNINKIVSSLIKFTHNYEFSTSFWFKDSLKIKEDFLTFIKEKIRTYVDYIKFDKFNTNEKSKINDWIKKVSNGKLKKLKISNKIANKDTRLIILNYLYFKDSWSEPFSKEFTTLDNFYSSDSKIRKYKFMCKTFNEYPVLLREKFTAFSLKYRYHNSNAFFVFPKKGSSIKSVLNILKDKYVIGEIILMERFGEKVELNLKLPKFKHSSSINLKKTLKKFGIKRIFSKNADLDKISKEKIMLKAIAQKTRISIDEQGTEASAISLMAAVSTCKLKEIHLKLDRPFIYFITGPKNVILFLGVFNGIN